MEVSVMHKDRDGLLSVVIPAYNESAGLYNISKMLPRLLAEHKIPYEIIFVDDGSTDDTWDVMKDCFSQNSRIKGVRFSRNFGKEAAILSGLSFSRGDCAVVIDADMQHPIEAIPLMYEKWLEGYQVVEGLKASRGKEGAVRRFFARLFYSIISKTIKIDMSRTSDFKLLDRRVVDCIISLPEQHMFFRALSSWVGFKTASVEFEVQERVSGQSKWSSWSLVKYAVRNITNFSAAPMQLVTILGGFTFVIAVVLGIQTLVKWFSGSSQEGFSTVILLLLLLSSVIMVSLGVIGYYISRIYDEVKGRPRYIVDDIIGKALRPASDEKHDSRIEIEKDRRNYNDNV